MSSKEDVELKAGHPPAGKSNMFVSDLKCKLRLLLLLNRSSVCLLCEVRHGQKTGLSLYKGSCHQFIALLPVKQNSQDQVSSVCRVSFYVNTVFECPLICQSCQPVNPLCSAHLSYGLGFVNIFISQIHTVCVMNVNDVSRWQINI